MYEAYYGLRERPFDLSPNPRFLFLSKKHEEALAHLRYGLKGRPGITVLIGEAGTGKTTLVRAALQPTNGSARNSVVHLSNPTLTRAEFYEYLSGGFSFSEAAAISKTRFLHELERALEDHPNDQSLALIVDEAQSLPHELLEEIRLLTNVQSASGRSLAVALVGQPELAIRLNEERLRQLKQRVALRCDLAPLDIQETAAYIAARIRVAGGRPEMLFTRDAVSGIHDHAHGIPRTISVICDNALINGFAIDVKPIGREIVLDVCRDFHFARLKADPVEQKAHGAKPALARAGAVPAQTDARSDQGAFRDNKSLFSGFTRKRFLFF